MDKDEALSICFANLKGSKDKDLLATAHALQFLKDLPEYGSNEKVGAAVGVSREIVREFVGLLRLPKQVWPFFADKKLGLDQGRRLGQVHKRRPKAVMETAQALIKLNEADSRALVEYIMNRPELSVAEAKRTVLDARTVTEREYHVIALLNEEQYRVLKRKAVARKVPVDQLVTAIVADWLRGRDG